MARLIKKDQKEAGAEPVPEPKAPRRGRRAIIDRDTYEARSDAQRIRDRAQAEADSTVSEAQTEAESLLAAAREEAEKLKAEAKELGLQEGRAEGAEQLAEVIAQNSRRAQELEAQVVPQLKSLALAIARKILGKELETHPDEVVNIIKQALGEKARQRRDIVLHLHPEDLQMVRERKAELLEVLSRCRDLAIRENKDVERHGVVIETDAGTIDAQLETQLKVFERVLGNMPSG